MSQGVPGIPPREDLRKAIGEASASPLNFSYSRWDGEPSLRAALVKEMKAVYGSQADIKMEDVALTAGCNLAFMAVIMTLADAGDEVILPVPWYVIKTFLARTGLTERSSIQVFQSRVSATSSCGICWQLLKVM